MGELQSISSNLFTQTGAEGTLRGVRLRNAALTRRMSWGDNWQTIRIGVVYSYETFGINRSAAQAGSSFYVGVCSGPWSVADPGGRTWRATGVQLLDAGNGSFCGDWHNSWTNTPVSSQAVWLNNGNGRGSMYYIANTTGSYANGGGGRKTLTNVRTGFANNGGQHGAPDTTSAVGRRTAAIIEIQRAPYLTGWSMRWICNTSGNASLASDMPLKSYFASLANTSASLSVNDGWYNLGLVTVTTVTQATATPDTRNSPMDYVDLYWDPYTMGLNLFRFDVRKFQ